MPPSSASAGHGRRHPRGSRGDGNEQHGPRRRGRSGRSNDDPARDSRGRRDRSNAGEGRHGPRRKQAKDYKPPSRTGASLGSPWSSESIARPCAPQCAAGPTTWCGGRGGRLVGAGRAPRALPGAHRRVRGAGPRCPMPDGPRAGVCPKHPLLSHCLPWQRPLQPPASWVVGPRESGPVLYWWPDEGWARARACGPLRAATGPAQIQPPLQCVCWWIPLCVRGSRSDVHVARSSTGGWRPLLVAGGGLAV
jgi:hypothetical protein